MRSHTSLHSPLSTPHSPPRPRKHHHHHHPPARSNSRDSKHLWMTWRTWLYSCPGRATSPKKRSRCVLVLAPSALPARYGTLSLPLLSVGSRFEDGSIPRARISAVFAPGLRPRDPGLHGPRLSCPCPPSLLSSSLLVEKNPSSINFCPSPRAPLAVMSLVFGRAYTLTGTATRLSLLIASPVAIVYISHPS